MYILYHNKLANYEKHYFSVVGTYYSYYYYYFTIYLIKNHKCNYYCFYKIHFTMFIIVWSCDTK